MSRRPNFIFIVADDLGYADLGCYGGRAPVSPVLDSLAANGLLFTEGYANSPVCSPTRFAMITGRYQYRLRGAAEEEGVPLHILIARIDAARIAALSDAGARRYRIHPANLASAIRIWLWERNCK